MSADELVPVAGLECRCEPPHEDGDTVYLRPKLGLQAGIAIQRLIVDARQADKPADVAELTGILAEAYLTHGVADWTFRTVAGKVPVTRDTIRLYLLDDFSRGAPVADAADDLYLVPVIAPLVAKASTSSPSSSNSVSTLATPRGGRSRKRSKRSSTTTTPTDGTATTSP